MDIGEILIKLAAIFYKFEILSLQKDLLVNSWDNVFRK